MRKRKADHPGKKKGLIKKEGLSELRPSFFWADTRSDRVMWSKGRNSPLSKGDRELLPLL
jgi:hypothetical protein